MGVFCDERKTHTRMRGHQCLKSERRSWGGLALPQLSGGSSECDKTQNAAPGSPPSSLFPLTLFHPVLQLPSSFITLSPCLHCSLLFRLAALVLVMVWLLHFFPRDLSVNYNFGSLLVILLMPCHLAVVHRRHNLDFTLRWGASAPFIALKRIPAISCFE